MEDPVLNRILEESKELQARWAQFRDFYTMAAKGQQKVTPQAEMKFLELKSRIAMLHDGFLEKLQHDQKTGQNIMNIVGDIILLARVPFASEAEKQKFEFDWNECYMLITEQVGGLEEEKQRLAGINENAYKAQKRKEEFTAKFHNFLHSSGLKYTFIALGIFMVVYGIPAFGIFDYKEFGNIGFTKPVYRLFVNKLFRPFVDSDLEYLDRKDVSEKEFTDTTGRVQAVTDQPLTDAFFKNTELLSMGVRNDQKKKIEDLLALPGAMMQFDRFKADAQDVRIYYIFLPKTEDAKTFVTTMQDAMRALTDANRKSVTDITYLTRMANFIILGRGGHTWRAEYPNGKFGLEATRPNLIIIK